MAAVMSGVALALAHPLPGYAGFAWCGPGLLVASAMGLRGWALFRLGWVAGLVQFLVALRWLLQIPFPVGAVAGWLALSSYLALFSAVWIWFTIRCLPGGGAADARAPEFAGGRKTGWEGWMGTARGMIHASWLQRFVWGIGAGVAWVALEMMQARLLSGFPWNFLGTTQHGFLPLIQLAGVTGVYGVSGMVVWCSLAGLCALLAILIRVGDRSVLEMLGSSRSEPGIGRSGGMSFSGRQAGAGPGRGGHPFRYSIWVVELVVPGLVLAALFVWGAGKVARFPAPSRTVKVALIQPSIPQTLIWDRSEDGRRFDKLLELSRLAAAAGPEVLIWPEAAMPSFQEENFRAITNLAGGSKMWMIFGADDYEQVRKESGETKDLFYNSAFLVGRDGKFQDSYRKRRLVVFGEYVPLVGWLPFLKFFTPIEGGFTPGTKAGRFEMGDLGVRGAVAICFEDIFPQDVRADLAGGADWLINLTNDGWFGEGSAQWQHAIGASFRAIENGVPLIRCTNNGLSCWVDPVGRIHEVYFGPDRDIYGAGFKLAEVGVWKEGQRPRTVYSKHGDVFGWSCVALFLMALAFKEVPGWMSGRRKGSGCEETLERK